MLLPESPLLSLPLFELLSLGLGLGLSGAFVFTVTSEPLSTLSPAFGENESTVASSLELLPSASLSVSPAF